MFAIIAAVLFGIALLFNLTGTTLSNIGADTFVIAGLLFVALHLAGVLTHARRRRF